MPTALIVLPVRKHSERVINKMLRPFAGSSLFEIYLDKLQGFKPDVIVAAHEQEFLDIADSRGFPCLKRTHESAHGETQAVIHSYAAELDCDYVFEVSACLPFIRPKTLEAAFAHLINQAVARPSYPGFVSAVRETRTLWDADGHLLTPDAGLLNTKRMAHHFANPSAFKAWNRERFLRTGRPWPFVDHDPELYEIPRAEAIDIDTMDDFEYAEWRWNRGQKHES